MIDYLIRYTTPKGEEPPVDTLPVALIEVPAVYGPADEDGGQEQLTPETRLAGSFALLAREVVDEALWSDPDTIAEIRREDGAVLRTRDEAVLGCALSAVWAGGSAGPLEMAEAEEPPEPSVPTEISDRQFAQVLALDGVITEDEALAWASNGTLPVAMEAAMQSIPEEGKQRFAAWMLLSSATVYERSHPLVPALGALLSMTPSRSTTSGAAPPRFDQEGDLERFRFTLSRWVGVHAGAAG